MGMGDGNGEPTTDGRHGMAFHGRSDLVLIRWMYRTMR